jgi:protein-tyrosine phosphatase
MNQVKPFPLWIGHSGENQDVSAIYETGIEAVVELAVEEPSFATPRELIACRIPLIDGAGNPGDRLALAVNTVAALIASGTPTLVGCGAGMSRAPAVVATALAAVHGGTPADWLSRVTEHHPSDVSPGLWADLVARPTEAATLGEGARRS